MSDDDLEATWAQRARAVDWIRRPRRVLDEDTGAWFPDATLNTCYNVLDRHVVHGHGDRDALVVAGGAASRRPTTTSTARLLEQVAAVAGALVGLGVGPGRRVMVHLPALPETVLVMLACARVGAVHAAVPVGSDAGALAAGLDRHRPTVVVTASCCHDDDGPVPLKPVLDEALLLARHQPATVLVVQRPESPASLLEPRDVDWALVLAAGAADPAGCVPVASPEPLYAVPAGAADSRATTEPELRRSGGHAVATAWAASQLLALEPGTLVWAPVDPASEAGHAGVYGPLLVGAATLVHELAPSGEVDPATLWRVVDEHGVAALLLTPDRLQALQEQDPVGSACAGRDLGALRAVLVGGTDAASGERAAWLQRLVDVPVRQVVWPFPEPAAVRRE